MTCNCDEQPVSIERTGDLTTITCLACGQSIVKDNRQSADQRDANVGALVLTIVSVLLIGAAITYHFAGSQSGVVWCAFSAAACAGLAPIIRRWGRP
jgi:hypothetical protein